MLPIESWHHLIDLFAKNDSQLAAKTCIIQRFVFVVIGLIVGAIIRFAGKFSSTHTHLQVDPIIDTLHYNDSLPPDTLWFNVRHEYLTVSEVPTPIDEKDNANFICGGVHIVVDN